MKKQYIIPTSLSVLVQVGSICQTSGGASGPSVNVSGPGINGNPNVQDIGDPD